jgi:hypothetical protein
MADPLPMMTLVNEEVQPRTGRGRQGAAPSVTAVAAGPPG